MLNNSYAYGDNNNKSNNNDNNDNNNNNGFECEISQNGNRCYLPFKS